MVETFSHLRDRADASRGWKSSRRLRIPVDPDLDPYELPLEEVNVANPELFRQQLVYPYFERLRDEAPVHFCADSQYGPYWSITRYDDIMAVEKNHQVFSSSFELGGVTITGTPNSSNEIPNFISMDPVPGKTLPDISFATSIQRFTQFQRFGPSAPVFELKRYS